MRVLVVYSEANKPRVRGELVRFVRVKKTGSNLALVVSEVYKNIVDFNPDSVHLFCSFVVQGLVISLIEEKFPNLIVRKM